MQEIIILSMDKVSSQTFPLSKYGIQFWIWIFHSLSKMGGESQYYRYDGVTLPLIDYFISIQIGMSAFLFGNIINFLILILNFFN